MCCRQVFSNVGPVDTKAQFDTSSSFGETPHVPHKGALLTTYKVLPLCVLMTLAGNPSQTVLQHRCGGLSTSLPIREGMEADKN